MTGRAGIAFATLTIAASTLASQALGNPWPHPRAARPNDPIVIQWVALSENDMHAGDSVTGTVITSVNVAAVTAQAGTYRLSVPKIGPGTFRKTMQVPRLWDWDWRGSVTITAIRTDGATVETNIPIEVRW